MKNFLICLAVTAIIMWGAATAWDKWGYHGETEQDSSAEDAAHYSK